MISILTMMVMVMNGPFLRYSIPALKDLNSKLAARLRFVKEKKSLARSYLTASLSFPPDASE